MGLPSITPRIGIIDDCDKPEAQMLVVVWGHPSRPRWEYINPKKRPMGGVIGRLNCYPGRFTPVEDFGVHILFEEDGALQVDARRGDSPCVARYPDGKPRPWQGRPVEAVEIRPQLAGPVLKAVREYRTARLKRAAERR